MLIFSLQNDRYTKFLALKKCRSQEEIQERMQTNVACILSDCCIAVLLRLLGILSEAISQDWIWVACV